MNIQVKQRVVGAIVLVALAVIFLPILLPGKGDLAMNIDESNVPPPPDFSFPPLEDAPKPPPLAQAPVLPIEAPADEPAPESGKKATPAPGAEEKSTGEQPAALKPSAAPIPKPGNERAPKPGEVTGWIVQLGSFSRQDNALSLRDELRKKGYNGFVEPVGSAGKTVYRVRVGPELTREAADGLREKLGKEMNMKGLVQQYP